MMDSSKLASIIEDMLNVSRELSEYEPEEIAMNDWHSTSVTVKLKSGQKFEISVKEMK